MAVDTKHKNIRDPKTGKLIPNPNYKAPSDNKQITNSDQIPKTRDAAFVPPAPAATVAQTTVGPAAQATAAQLGPAAQAQAAQLGPTATSAGAQADLTNDNQFRAGQQGLVSQLQNQANGVGPSVSGLQFAAAANKNIAQQSALAASQRGSAGALAGRQAMLNSAGIGQNLAGQSAILRLQEQQAAQAQLGAVLGQGRTADQNAAFGNATLNQGNQQFNAGQSNTANIAQGQLTQGANLANADALNANNLAQGQFTQGTNLANAGFTNQLTAQQGNINAAAATQNALAQNTNIGLGAQLNNQVNLANSDATNRANISGAQIKGSEINAKTGANAQITAANAQAAGGISQAQINQNAADERNRENLQYLYDQNGGGGAV